MALAHLGTSLLQPVLPSVQLACLVDTHPPQQALSVASVLLVNMVQLLLSALILTVSLVVLLGTLVILAVPSVLEPIKTLLGVQLARPAVLATSPTVLICKTMLYLAPGL